MPWVEEVLAGYFSPGVASSLKAPVLTFKPCQTTLRLVCKAYTVTVQNSMIFFKALWRCFRPTRLTYLKDLDQGKRLSPKAVLEFHRAKISLSPCHKGDDPFHRSFNGCYDCHGEASVAKSIGDKEEGEILSPQNPSFLLATA